MVIKTISSILIALLFFVTGCSMDTNNSPLNEFSFSLTIDVLKDTSNFVNMVDHARITVLDLHNNPIVVNKVISLTKDGYDFKTSQMVIPHKKFKITELCIYDENGNLLFYTPGETSYFKDEVKTPLPLEVKITEKSNIINLEAVVTNEIISTIDSNDFTVRFETRDTNGIIDTNIKVRHNHYVLDEQTTTDGRASCIFNETFDVYQFDFIKTGYDTKTITLLSQDVQKVAYTDSTIYLLRTDASIEFTENVKTINWIGGSYISLYSFLTDSTRETYSAASFAWSINTISGPVLSINSEGVINFSDNQPGEYLISVDDKVDFHLRITETKYNEVFDEFLIDFEAAGKKYDSPDFSIAAEGTLAVAFDSGNSLNGANGRAFHPTSGEYDMVVLISPDHWKFASRDEKELLMFHELGHAVLRRITHESTYINHYGASIMCGTKPNEGFYNDFKVLYQEELFTADMSALEAALQDYSSTKCDLAPTRVGMGTYGLKMTVANHYITEVKAYRVKLIINGNIFYSPSNNTDHDYNDGGYSSTFYVDRLPHFAKGEILDITIIVDDEEITNDIDRSNNTLRTSLIWTNG